MYKAATTTEISIFVVNIKEKIQAVTKMVVIYIQTL